MRPLCVCGSLSSTVEKLRGLTSLGPERQGPALRGRTKESLATAGTGLCCPTTCYCAQTLSASPPRAVPLLSESSACCRTARGADIRLVRCSLRQAHKQKLLHQVVMTTLSCYRRANSLLYCVRVYVIAREPSQVWRQRRPYPTIRTSLEAVKS